jgi:hypothetical protein
MLIDLTSHDRPIDVHDVIKCLDLISGEQQTSPRGPISPSASACDVAGLIFGRVLGSSRFHIFFYIEFKLALKDNLAENLGFALRVDQGVQLVQKKRDVNYVLDRGEQLINDRVGAKTLFRLPADLLPNFIA